MLVGMSRVSQAQARENRQRVVETAARLFRERGVAHVSVADVMAGAGLTHGGFYKQFTSKEALAVEALAQGLAEIGERLATIGAPGDESGWASFLDFYLSADHRDSPGDGCPVAGFARDMPGADADLTIIDLEKEQPVTVELLHSAQDHTPFAGMPVKGWPVLTMLRGVTVFKDGEIIGGPTGEFLSRPLSERRVPVSV